MKLFAAALAFAVVASGAPLAATPKFLDCNNAPDKELCQSSQSQLREEAGKSSTDYTAMRNVAYCLWTGCDGAVARDNKAACLIRRAIMKRHQKKVDGNDELHFARCVQAGL